MDFSDSGGSGDTGSLGGLANFKIPWQAASRQKNIDEFVSILAKMSLQFELVSSFGKILSIIFVNIAGIPVFHPDEISSRISEKYWRRRECSFRETFGQN